MKQKNCVTEFTYLSVSVHTMTHVDEDCWTLNKLMASSFTCLMELIALVSSLDKFNYYFRFNAIGHHSNVKDQIPHHFGN